MPSVPYVAINLIAERQVAEIATKGTRSTKARELQRAEKGREGPPGRLVTVSRDFRERERSAFAKASSFAEASANMSADRERIRVRFRVLRRPIGALADQSSCYLHVRRSLVGGGILGTLNFRTSGLLLPRQRRGSDTYPQIRFASSGVGGPCFSFHG